MTPFLRLSLLIGVVLLSACSAEEHQDLKEWMRDSSKDLRGGVPPLPALTPFPIVSYDASNVVDPFRPSKIVPVSVPGEGGKTPDFDRRKEPLEEYPLESLKLVGVVLPGKGVTKTPYGLVQSSGGLYFVVVGSHLGQNFGVVTAITDSEVKIKETVKDPTGQTADWVERQTSLNLEGAKK